MRATKNNGWLGRSLTALFAGAVLISGPTAAAAAVVFNTSGMLANAF